MAGNETSRAVIGAIGVIVGAIVGAIGHDAFEAIFAHRPTLGELIYSGHTINVTFTADTGGIREGNVATGTYLHDQQRQVWTFIGANTYLEDGYGSRTFGCGGVANTERYACVSPLHSEILVWGVEYKFDKDGNLTFVDGRPSGTMQVLP